MAKPQKQETIIFGGAFNPPTLAHVEILQACIDYARMRGASVWLMPSGDRVDKTIATPTVRRLEYLSAMIADVDTKGVDVDVCFDELSRQVAVETYDTVTELADKYPDRELIWVFGADSTETMAEWKEGQWLLDNLSMIAIHRQGSTINPLAKKVVPIRIKTMGLSSTQVRERMALGKPIDALVSVSVGALLK